MQSKHDRGEKFQGVLFDIDGVLEFQGKAYPGAVELPEVLREKEIEIRILTNSTLKSRKACAAKLHQLGFDVLEEEVIKASWATARYLEALNPKSCWVMLKGKGIEEFRNVNLDDENPEYTVLGGYREGFNFENMNRVLMIGDRVATDILGARRAGIKSVLVKTGEFKKSDLNGEVQPDYIVNSVRKIDALF